MSLGQKPPRPTTRAVSDAEVDAWLTKIGTNSESLRREVRHGILAEERIAQLLAAWPRQAP